MLHRQGRLDSPSKASPCPGRASASGRREHFVALNRSPQIGVTVEEKPTEMNSGLGGNGSQKLTKRKQSFFLSSLFYNKESHLRVWYPKPSTCSLIKYDFEHGVWSMEHCSVKLTLHRYTTMVIPEAGGPCFWWIGSSCKKGESFQTAFLGPEILGSTS
jgi:hypothetical protein